MTLRDWFYLAGLVVTVGIQWKAYGALIQKVIDNTKDIEKIDERLDGHDDDIKEHHGRLSVLEAWKQGHHGRL